jgi:hypothetical protein
MFNAEGQDLRADDPGVRRDRICPLTPPSPASTNVAKSVGQLFYTVNLNTFTYVPSHERQAVRVLEDAAQRDVQRLNRKPYRDNKAGSVPGPPCDEREDRSLASGDGAGKQNPD